MKGYLIDALARRITVEDYQYGEMTKWMPGGICVGATFENGDTLFVDDEGLLRPADRAFRIKRRTDGQPMMSNGFLVGRDTNEDEDDGTLPPQFTLAELAAEIEWLDLADARAWFEQRASQPAVVVHDDAGTEVIASWRDIMDRMDEDHENST
jgi:hypothetical protein